MIALQTIYAYRTRITAVYVLLLFATAAFAQDAQEPLDRAWQQNDIKDREPLPYDHIREADVFWAKRIWRIIDVREKMNLPFKYPQQPLAAILHRAAKSGELTVYDPAVIDVDQFKKVMDKREVEVLGSRRDTVLVVDPVSLEESYQEVVNEFDPGKVVKYRIKEDWFFDEETSTMQVRIIGIAPVLEDYDANGNYRGDMTMYWIYYPDLRPMLAKYEAFNTGNDAMRLSWDDVFEARLFQSYIYKESNVHDRNIQEYATGQDALLESDRIKNDIFNFEHDLWNY